VTIDVHGPLDRAKDVSSNNGERAFSRLPCRVRALGARRRRSPPQHPEDTRCRRCVCAQGKRPTTHERRTGRASRSSGVPRRMPAPHDAGCLPPSATTGAREDCSSPLPASASRSRRPHVAPRLGTSAWMGLASVSAERTLRGLRESSAPLITRWFANARAWD